MTYEEFMALPDVEGQHCELIEGELYLNAAPFPRHQRIVRALFRALDHYFEQHGGGEVWFAPLDFVLSRENVLEPDLAVIKTERATIVGPKNVEGPPDIAIEVHSEGTRRKDRVIKRRVYERYGVAEIWLVDPEDRSVTVIRNGQETRVTDTLTLPLLADFALPLHDVFPK